MWNLYFVLNFVNFQYSSHWFDRARFCIDSLRDKEDLAIYIQYTCMYNSKANSYVENPMLYVKSIFQTYDTILWYYIVVNTI